MTTLLLDADIVAYKVAARNQEDFDWGDTGESRVVDHERAICDTDSLISEYCEALKAQKVLICLTDPAANFRKELEPTYKANRKNHEKPELLQWVKDYLAHEYQSFIRPRLEADDIMGIIATAGDRIVKGPKVIVSEDKDLKTIPGHLYNPRRPDDGVVEISPLDAKRFHMEQTLTGDPSDGYIGCRGIGVKSPYVKALWEAEAKDLWEIVLAGYASKGKPPEDALLQARIAYILQFQSYSLKHKTIFPWTPELL